MTGCVPVAEVLQVVGAVALVGLLAGLVAFVMAAHRASRYVGLRRRQERRARRECDARTAARALEADGHDRSSFEGR